MLTQAYRLHRQTKLLRRDRAAAVGVPLLEQVGHAAPVGRERGRELLDQGHVALDGESRVAQQACRRPGLV